MTNVLEVFEPEGSLHQHVVNVHSLQGLKSLPVRVDHLNKVREALVFVHIGILVKCSTFRPTVVLSLTHRVQVRLEVSTHGRKIQGSGGAEELNIGLHVTVEEVNHIGHALVVVLVGVLSPWIEDSTEASLLSSTIIIKSAHGSI